MNNLEHWGADNEVSGCMELRRQILSDSVSFTKFSTPQRVELTTQESQSKRTIEDIPIDFVYNMRQSDGINSTGWQGAGFLNGKLQYAGFTSYNQEKGKICANRGDLIGRKVTSVDEVKNAIRDYYRDEFHRFEQAIESLPEYMSTARELLL